jgi:anaerobic selenocysteine-containing dehydrogenase
VVRISRPGNPETSPGHRFGISRRAFLKLTGLAVAVAALGRLIKRPALSSIVPVDDFPEGEGVLTEAWLPTSCLNCATRCATRVRVVNGRAVKITGNPLSQVAEGENCARAQVGLQVLYDPTRFTTPLRRTNPAKGRDTDPQWTPVSWDEALAEVSGRLKDLRAGGGPHRLLLLSGLNTVSDEDILRRFAAAYGTPNLVTADGLNNEADKAGEWCADGNFSQSAYDLERTNYILAFGAGILESYEPLARSLRMWGKIRRERPNRAKVVVVDPRYSVTALRADRWLPVNPGTDGALAMALAHVIISENLYDSDFIGRYTHGFSDYQDLVLGDYAPEKVATVTGIPAATIYETAREFAATRPAIAWRGRGATGWPGGTYTAYAIFCLNALVGSLDTPGGVIYQEEPPYRALPEITPDTIAQAGLVMPPLDGHGGAAFPAARTVTNQVAEAILEENPYPVAMAIGFNTNFNLTAPGTWRWDEALARLPYYVHVAAAPDEMASFADIILPSTTFLETWAYDHSPPGSGFAEVRIKQPVVAPLYSSRNIADMIFDIAGRMGSGVADAFRNIGDSAEGFVRYRTAGLADWADLLAAGVWVGPAYRYDKYGQIFATPSGRFEFRSGNLAAALQKAGESTSGDKCLPHYEPPDFIGSSSEYPLTLLSYQPLLNVDGDSRSYPWAQEMFLVMHGQGWTNFAEMNRATAQELNIKDGDAVWVESPFGRVKTRARVFEGILPGVVAIARGLGVNPNGVAYDKISGQAARGGTRVRVYKA